MGLLSRMGRGAGRALAGREVEYGLLGAMAGTAGLGAALSAGQAPADFARDQSNRMIQEAAPGLDFQLGEAELDALIEQRFSGLPPERKAALKRQILMQQAMSAGQTGGM